MTVFSDSWLAFTALWANSAENKLVTFSPPPPPPPKKKKQKKNNRIWHFMQIVFIGDNLHEMYDLVFWEK